jgi:hypothetical protein
LAQHVFLAAIGFSECVCASTRSDGQSTKERCSGGCESKNPAGSTPACTVGFGYPRGLEIRYGQDFHRWLLQLKRKAIVAEWLERVTKFHVF